MPLYFAYGSNMDSTQMARRAPKARAHGPGRLRGYRFTCNKVGRDGSAKANVERADEAAVWGVLFEISAADLVELDRFEGGYWRESLAVETTGGAIEVCEVYVSDLTSQTLLPLRAYRERMVRGAREHRLPQACSSALEGLAVSD